MDKTGCKNRGAAAGTGLPADLLPGSRAGLRPPDSPRQAPSYGSRCPRTRAELLGRWEGVHWRRLRSLQTRMAGGAGVSIHGASGAGLGAARQWLCPTSALQHSGRHKTAMHVPYIPASPKTWIWTCFHVDVGAARLSSANQISHGDGRLHCPAAVSPPGHRFQEQVPLSPVFFK